MAVLGWAFPGSGIVVLPYEAVAAAVHLYMIIDEDVIRRTWLWDGAPTCLDTILVPAVNKWNIFTKINEQGL